MVIREKLDVARLARTGQLILPIMLLAIASSVGAQEFLSDAARLSAVQKACDAGQWEQAAKLANGPAEQPAELDFLAGFALAKLQRWNDARQALHSGMSKSPGDGRFLVELAGVDYKQNDLRQAKADLHKALQLDSRDAYTQQFLGTIYFLEGNLEAALKYWNSIDEPRLRRVTVEPPPRVDETLLNRAIGFNAPQVLTREAVLTAEARTANLGIYAQQRIALTPAGDGAYDATLHLRERNGWGDSKLEGALTLLSGLPYATVYPSFYNLDHRAINVTSLLRWDSEKRRASFTISTPILNDPALRVQGYFDARNENWNLTHTLFASGTSLSDLNMRRFAAGVELISVANGRWSWETGFEVANRRFRNLAGHTSAAEKLFFADGTSLVYWFRVNRSLLRIPERRFTVDGTGEGRIGRDFAIGSQAFGALGGGLRAHWLPQAAGDDYEMQAQLRGGEALGQVPFDELFQLGIERDNDLWLRGHPGTIGGRKGAGPLGRRFLLANWELDKNVYANGFFTVKLGPFIDSGTIADPSGLFGSERWLWDTGAQCKIRVLGSMTVVLSYGRDLRGGRNAFYGTVVH
jgi:tetratricopeptide (TPR) repeat protein